MTVCKEYEVLSDIERAIYMGKVVHCIQSNSKMFEIGQRIIRMCEKDGIFDGVKFMPDHAMLHDQILENE